MTRRSACWLALLVLHGWLVVPAGSYGWELPGRSCDGCPPTSYSGCHYWTPTLYRLNLWWHGQTMDKRPISLAAPYKIDIYGCPAVDPTTRYYDSVYAWFAWRGETKKASDAAAPTTPPAEYSRDNP